MGFAFHREGIEKKPQTQVMMLPCHEDFNVKYLSPSAADPSLIHVQSHKTF